MDHNYEHYKLKCKDKDTLLKVHGFLLDKVVSGVPLFGFFEDWQLELCRSRTSVVPEFFGLQYLEDSGEVCFSVAENCVSEEDFDLIQELADLFETSFDVTQVVEWYENEWMKFGAERSFVAKDSVQLRQELSDKVERMIRKYGTSNGFLSLQGEWWKVRVGYSEPDGRYALGARMGEAEFTTGTEIVPLWVLGGDRTEPVVSTPRHLLNHVLEGLDDLENSLREKQKVSTKISRGLRKFLDMFIKPSGNGKQQKKR